MEDISAIQIWVIIGVVALIVELLSTSFVSLFFSIGGLLTALFTWIDILPNFNSQLLCFSVVSVLSLLVLRKPLRELSKRHHKSLEYSEYIGDKATVIQAIPPKGEGKVFYRGTDWIAISNTDSIIESGKSVIIKQLDGIKLLVEAA